MIEFYSFQCWLSFSLNSLEFPILIWNEIKKQERNQIPSASLRKQNSFFPFRIISPIQMYSLNREDSNGQQMVESFLLNMFYRTCSVRFSGFMFFS